MATRETYSIEIEQSSYKNGKAMKRQEENTMTEEIYIGWEGVECSIENGKETTKRKISVCNGRTGEQVGYFEVNSPKIPEGCIICNSEVDFWEKCAIYADTKEGKEACRRRIEKTLEKRRAFIKFLMDRHGMTEFDAKVKAIMAENGWDCSLLLK